MIGGRLRARHVAEWKTGFGDKRQLLESPCRRKARRPLRLQPREDVLRLPVLLAIAVAALSPVAWLSIQADSDLQKAGGVAPTIGRSEIPKHFEAVRVANQTSARILALDEARRLAFWTLVLKSRNQACDGVVRASYTGATGAGLDQWTVVCRDGTKYSISVEPNAKDSVCVGNAFDRSATWGRM